MIFTVGKIYKKDEILNYAELLYYDSKKGREIYFSSSGLTLPFERKKDGLKYLGMFPDKKRVK